DKVVRIEALATRNMNEGRGDILISYNVIKRTKRKARTTGSRLQFPFPALLSVATRAAETSAA
ncbi:hypothetical protein K0M31_004739, partial [Melipona bicolor]